MIAGFMRIKNEQRFIGKVLDSLVPAVDRIFVLDDQSTDQTRDICRSYRQVTLFESPFDGTVNEVRDKNWLLERVEKEVPAGTYLIAIDGDEEVAPGGAAIIQEIASKPRNSDAFQFRVLYLWDSPRQIRVDGVYRDFHRPSMFRLRPGARFHSGAGGGFHCGNVPQPQHMGRCDVQLLHYGYMLKSDRKRKWDFYNQHDEKNRSEGYDPKFPERRSYPHVVQGDVPEVPANAVLMHAGPLRLEPLGVRV